MQVLGSLAIRFRLLLGGSLKIESRREKGSLNKGFPDPAWKLLTMQEPAPSARDCQIPVIPPLSGPSPRVLEF